MGPEERDEAEVGLGKNDDTARGLPAESAVCGRFDCGRRRRWGDLGLVGWDGACGGDFSA